MLCSNYYYCFFIPRAVMTFIISNATHSLPEIHLGGIFVIIEYVAGICHIGVVIQKCSSMLRVSSSKSTPELSISSRDEIWSIHLVGSDRTMTVAMWHLPTYIYAVKYHYSVSNNKLSLEKDEKTNGMLNYIDGLYKLGYYLSKNR